MKFIQPPDLTPAGVDVLCLGQSGPNYRKLADDWICELTGPVSRITFWVSFLEDQVSPPLGVHLSVHADSGVGLPGPLLDEWDLVPGQFTMTLEAAGTEEAFVDPMTGQLGVDHEVWRIDCDIPPASQWTQIQGNTYWLDVTVLVPGMIGWKTTDSPGQTPNFAVWTPIEAPEPPWDPIGLPPAGSPANLSFAIETADATTTTTAPQGTTTSPQTTEPCECLILADDVPPEGCQYQSLSENWQIIDGLPPGTTIELDTIMMNWANVLRTPGGTLGGEVETFDSTLDMTVSGTGVLAGFNRHLSVPAENIVHTGPRTGGDPEQAFPQDWFQLQGEIFGDPDFCTFKVRAGTNLGLPSPGQTTLSQRLSGEWAVDSFFDITYQIEFMGCPGSVLDGLSGITTGTVRVRTGPPCITAPPTTTTAPPVTTTAPPVTTTAPPDTHPADTGPGVPNWRCEPVEVVTYAATWLGGGTLSFKGVPLTGPGVAQAYILRAAAITLANFQARYDDVGTGAPVNSTAHPQRWQEIPDA